MILIMFDIPPSIIFDANVYPLIYDNCPQYILYLDSKSKVRGIRCGSVNCKAYVMCDKDEASWSFCIRFGTYVPQWIHTMNTDKMIFLRKQHIIPTNIISHMYCQDIHCKDFIYFKQFYFSLQSWCADWVFTFAFGTLAFMATSELLFVLKYKKPP